MVEEFIYGTPTYWDNLNQNEKDYYAKGVLDARGYDIYNQAPDKQKDELKNLSLLCPIHY